MARSRIDIHCCRWVLVILTLFTSLEVMAFGSWWQCSGKKGGEWNFGRTPSVCLVDHMQKQSFVKRQYKSVIFNDRVRKSSERKRYLTELNALVSEVGTYYLKRRKPGVSSAEVRAFIRGLKTLMHQETYWSHYRKSSDNRIRYMRGDVGHGHGIMQVDDRSHQRALRKGKGADLIYNMMYGLDVYYTAWQKAPKKSCVRGNTDYVARVRSAWAAYNGGIGRLCRWTKRSGRYAHHDKAFYSKYKNRQWRSYITNNNRKTDIDVKCMAEGTRPCGAASGGGGSVGDPIPDPVVTLKERELYKTSSSKYCILKDKALQCISRLDDVNCLQVREGIKYLGASNISSETESKYTKVNIDPHKLCLGNIKGLYSVGAQIQLKKRIILRSRPGGKAIKTLGLGTRYSTLDFNVLNTDKQERYYKIKSGSRVGYIFSGDKNNFASWVKKVSSEVKPPSVLASVGDKIEVVAPRGITMRSKISGKALVLVAKGSVLTVNKRVIRGSKSFVYYKVKYNGRNGFIYSGHLRRSSTVGRWTVKVSEKSAVRLAVLKSNSQYKMLRSCPRDECSLTNNVLRKPIVCEFDACALNVNKDEYVVQKRESGWVKLMSRVGNKTGWIKEIFIDEEA